MLSEGTPALRSYLWPAHSVWTSQWISPLIELVTSSCNHLSILSPAWGLHHMSLWHLIRSQIYLPPPTPAKKNHHYYNALEILMRSVAGPVCCFLKLLQLALKFMFSKHTLCSFCFVRLPQPVCCWISHLPLMENCTGSQHGPKATTFS